MTDSEAALNYLQVVLKKAQPYNSGLRSCCPFHSEDTPSFFVFPGKYEHEGNYYYKCHGCGASGSGNKLLDIYGYTQHRFKHRTLDVNRDIVHETVPYKSDTSIIYSRVYHYFYKRGLSRETCDRFGLRFDLGQLRAVIPVYTKHRFQGNIYRNLDSKIKYKIEADMNMTTALFGYDECDLQQTTFCVEGPLDALCMFELGFQAVALISKASWKAKLSLLNKFRHLVYIGDNDVSGMQTSKELLTEGFQTVVIPIQYKDINDFILDDNSKAKVYFGGFCQ